MSRRMQPSAEVTIKKHNTHIIAATVVICAALVSLGLVLSSYYAPSSDSGLRADMELCLDTPVYNTLELLAQCLDDVDKAH
jgi:hypothetical protein